MPKYSLFNFLKGCIAMKQAKALFKNFLKIANKTPHQKLKVAVPQSAEVHINTVEIDRSIIKALENTKYIARTFSGIAHEIKISENEVINRLKDRSLKNQIKIYPRKAKNGALLITTKSRFKKNASTLDKLFDLINDKDIDVF